MSTEELRDECGDERQHLIDGLTNDKIWSDGRQIGVIRDVISESHQGRTILELIQNARDAIRKSVKDSGHVAVIVFPEKVVVANQGKPFELHEEFEAVTEVGKSNKLKEKGSIGKKGVGLMSILRISKSFHIHTKLDEGYLGAEFSKAKTIELLLDEYYSLLCREEYQNKLLEDGAGDGIQKAKRLLDDLEICTEASREVSPDTEDISNGQDLPHPHEVFKNLPTISPFRNPSVIDERDSASEISRLLLKGEDPDVDIKDETEYDWLGKTKSREEDEEYQTVLEIDYGNKELSGYLDKLSEGMEEKDMNGIEEFEDSRDDNIDEDPQKTVWNECTSFSTETLTLLEDIDKVEFVKIEESEDGHRVSEVRVLEKEEDDKRESSGDLTRKDVELEIIHEKEGENSEHNDEEYALYSKEVTSESKECDDDESDEIRMLIEKYPYDTDSEIPRSPKPLHLYYPIEEAWTPFGFAIHAPFEVGFDRQSLKQNNDKNEELLEQKIPDFVAEVAEDMVKESEVEDEKKTGVSGWMPWVVMPVEDHEDREDTDGIHMDGVKEILDGLCETEIVPSDSTAAGDGSLKPVETLIDPYPDRIMSFEVIRDRARDMESTVPLPSSKVVERGRDIFDMGQWDNPESADRERYFWRLAAGIGLTEMIKNPLEDEGCMGVLEDVWGADEETNGSLEKQAIEVEDSAEQYFRSLKSLLERLEKNENKDRRKAEKRLLDNGIPAIPAKEKGTDTEHEDDDKVGYLVRALRQNDDRNDRVVFRPTEDMSEDGMDLPVPPTREIPIYIVPDELKGDFRGLIDSSPNGNWGTREFGGGADFYTTVVSKIGGYNTEPTEHTSDNLNYLLKLYRRVCLGEGETSKKLHPIPHNSRRFEDVEESLTGAKVKETEGISFTDFRERRYTQRVRLPTADDDSAPAETLVFGSAWKSMFKSAAKELDEGMAFPNKEEADDGYPFEDELIESAEELATRLRRWAISIETVDRVRDDKKTQRIAEPENFRVYMEGEDSFWIVCLLIHLGVQVGPKVEWGYFKPGEKQPEICEISQKEIQNMVIREGKNEEKDDEDYSLPKRLNERYRKVCWRSENHPAFSAGHSDNCNLHKEVEINQLELGQKNDRIVISTFCHFPILSGDIDDEKKEGLRDSIALIWDVLSETILFTTWKCSGIKNKHQIKSKEKKIPSSALVQIRQKEMWPKSSGDGGGETDASEDGTFGSGWYLLKDAKNISLPTLDIDRVRKGINSRVHDEAEVDLPGITEAVESDLIKSIDSMTPAEAAEILYRFLEEEKVGDIRRREVYRLMDQFENTDEMPGSVDSEREWVRRDIWHTGTRLLVEEDNTKRMKGVGSGRNGDSSSGDVFQGTAMIYDEEPTYIDIDDYSDEQEAILVTRDGGHGTVEKYLQDEKDDDVEFGIEEEEVDADIPTISESRLPDSDPDDGIKEIKDRLSETETVELLLAAYYESSQAGLERVEERHEEIKGVHNQVRVAEPDDIDGYNEDIKSVPISNGNEEDEYIGIAILDRGHEPSLYQVSDGIALSTDNYDRRRDFENVLLNLESEREEYLRSDYEEQLTKIRGMIDDLRAMKDEQTRDRIKGFVQSIEDGDGDADEDMGLPRKTETGDDSEQDRETFVLKDAVEERGDLYHNTIDVMESDTRLDERGAELLLEAAVRWQEGEKKGGKKLLCRLFLESDDIELGDIDVQGLTSGWNGIQEWDDKNDTRVYDELAWLQSFFGELSEDPDDDGIRNAIQDAKGEAPPFWSVADIPGCEDDVPLAAVEYDVDADLEGSSVPDYDKIGKEVLEWWNGRKDIWEDDAFGFISGPLSKVDDGIEHWDEKELQEGVKELKQRMNSPRSDSGGGYGSREERRRAGEDMIVERDWKGEDLDDVNLYGEPLDENDRGDIKSTDVGGGSDSLGDATEGSPDEEQGLYIEILCIVKSLEKFCSIGQGERERVMDEIDDWREEEKYRIGNGVDDDVKEVLTRDDISEEDEEVKKAYRDAVSVAEIGRCGFDYIDPFARSDDSDESDGWSKDDMRRVEVKSVKNPDASGWKVKMTGNEMRMAARDQDTHTLRVVSVKERGDKYVPINVDDVDRVVDKCFDEHIGSDCRSSDTGVAGDPLDRLRGGSFYVYGGES